jgi:hypothetical protein
MREGFFNLTNRRLGALALERPLRANGRYARADRRRLYGLTHGFIQKGLNVIKLSLSRVTGATYMIMIFTLCAPTARAGDLVSFATGGYARGLRTMSENAQDRHRRGRIGL